VSEAETAPEQSSPPAPQSIPPTPSHGRPDWVLPMVTGVVGVVLGVAATSGVTSALDGAEEREAAEAAAAAEEAQQAVLTDAMTSCDVKDGNAGVRVGDEGRTLTVDHKGGEDFTGASSDDLFCIVAALGTPSSVVSHMEQTTSMDGRQTESWDDVTVSWSYHPDRGMDSVFTVE
jgi:hypothetical protein